MNQEMDETEDRTIGAPDGARELLDRLAEEFAERCRQGDPPAISEFAARHPEHAEELRELLSTVALMEQLRRRAREEEGGRGRRLPERVDEFRILRELGRGGMGVVYEALQESLGRHVALKMIHLLDLDARRRKRFQREAQAIARLHHTNIVPIFAVGEHEGLPYYVMQYIRGQGLDALLKAWRLGERPRDGERCRFAARVAFEAARALEYAHEQGILHRDIKPANLLVDESRAVWITDFGVAKLIGQDDLTATGDVIGTLRYLAPETLRGATDRRSDVYSLGLTLYELLTLNPPFGEVGQSELLRRVSEGEPTRPRQLAPAIPRDLETIVLKAIAREPDHRYPTAGALADDLDRYLEDRPILARRTTALERLWRWSRRNRSTAALVGTAAGALVLAAIIGWVGYMSTIRALGTAELATRRAERNEALSLEVIGELFDRLASNDPLPPPPLGQSGRRTAPASAPGPGPHPMDFEDERPPPPRGHAGGLFPPGPGRFADRPDVAGRSSPPPPTPVGEGLPFEQGPPSVGNPHGGLPGARPDTDVALLRSVLSFYDRFASQNATNPRLRGEAAWAYRKVGVLYERLGRDAEAAQAFGFAIKMFEGLVALDPGNNDYKFKLVDTYDMADPWSAAEASLAGLERNFRRGRTLIDQLSEASPDHLEYAQGRVHVHAKLGVILQRLGRVDEAEACYRGTLAIEGNLIERWPLDGRLRMDRATTLAALAGLEFDRGRKDEARTLVDLAAAELQAIASDPKMPEPSPDHYESLAHAYERLGESGRAEAMARRAGEVGPGPGDHFSGPPGRGPGSHPR